ncbi:MAG: hypothetical protein SOV37_04805, partial [Candidatus Borkfalkiaceae bacterium]|nr:hypothetical protein [Christensenellaceae bacterium]
RLKFKSRRSRDGFFGVLILYRIFHLTIYKAIIQWQMSREQTYLQKFALSTLTRRHGNPTVIAKERSDCGNPLE